MGAAAVDALHVEVEGQLPRYNKKFIFLNMCLCMGEPSESRRNLK